MIRYRNIILLSTAILLTACGGGSTDDPNNIDNSDNIHQPDPAKSIGNDGSGVIYQYDPVIPIASTNQPANQPNMTIPTPVLSLPSDRRI